MTSFFFSVTFPFLFCLFIFLLQKIALTFSVSIPFSEDFNLGHADSSTVNRPKVHKTHQELKCLYFRQNRGLTIWFNLN